MKAELKTDLYRDLLLGQMRLFDSSDDLALGENMSFAERAGMVKVVKFGELQAKAQEIRKKGNKVFTLGADVVEADFGAPSVGLKLAFDPDIVDLERAYRYEPLISLDGNFYSHVKQAKIVAQNLHRRGYKTFAEYLPEEYPLRVHFSGGGISKPFNHVVDILIEEFEYYQQIRKKYGHHTEKGVILVPVPNYGLYLSLLKLKTAEKDIDVRYIYRNDNGSVNQVHLERNIGDIISKGERLVAYYDCNPHNPTGYIRGKEETQDIAGLLSWAFHNNVQNAQCFLLEQLPRATIKTHEDLSQVEDVAQDRRYLANYVYPGPYGQGLIIDDMAYEGLELTSDRPFSFAQLQEEEQYDLSELADLTVVLKGISKIGAPNLRAGLCIAHDDIIARLGQRQLREEFAASSFVVDLITARHGTTQQKRKFRSHIDKIRRTHDKKKRYFQMLFEGIEGIEDDRNFVKEDFDKDIGKFIQGYAKKFELTFSEAVHVLAKGLPGFSILNAPDSGFFWLVDFERLRSQKIYVEIDDNIITEEPINEGIILYHALLAFGVKAIPAASMGMPEDSLVCRLSFSIADEALMELHKNLSEAHNWFFGINAGYQLDMFRSPCPISYS